MLIEKSQQTSAVHVGNIVQRQLLQSREAVSRQRHAKIARVALRACERQVSEDRAAQRAQRVVVARAKVQRRQSLGNDRGTWLWTRSEVFLRRVGLQNRKIHQLGVTSKQLTSEIGLLTAPLQIDVEMCQVVARCHQRLDRLRREPEPAVQIEREAHQLGPGLLLCFQRLFELLIVILLCAPVDVVHLKQQLAMEFSSRMPENFNSTGAEKRGNSA